jgi:hypothetical protein
VERQGDRPDGPPNDHGRLAGAGGHDRGSGVTTGIGDRPPQ